MNACSRSFYQRLQADWVNETCIWDHYVCRQRELRLCQHLFFHQTFTELIPWARQGAGHWKNLGEQVAVLAWHSGILEEGGV